MDPDEVTLDEARELLQLPRVVGVDPTDGTEIVARNGRYGPYLSKDKDTRSLETEDSLLTVTLEEALALFAQPKRRRARQSAPGRDIGTDPASGKPVQVKDGRFGPYVTDGEVNASLRKADDPATITIDRAAELLQLRRDRIAAKG
jgi:DNA topoisomerase-1